jgi:hypothetical protein
MAGCSSSPLWKKLGYKPGVTVHVHEAPANYRDELKLVDPKSVTWLKEPIEGVQLIHAFTRRLAELKKLLALYRKRVAPDGAIWISWPKEAAKVETDITEDRVRDAALPLGLVDIKVCAVDDVWSGLKLVVRKKLR